MMTDGEKGVGLQLPHISQTRVVKFSWCLHRLNALIKKKNSLIHKQRAVWESRCNQGLLLVLQVLVQVQVQAPVQEQGSSPPPQALPSNC